MDASTRASRVLRSGNFFIGKLETAVVDNRLHHEDDLLVFVCPRKDLPKWIFYQRNDPKEQNEIRNACVFVGLVVDDEI